MSVKRKGKTKIEGKSKNSDLKEIIIRLDVIIRLLSEAESLRIGKNKTVQIARTVGMKLPAIAKLYGQKITDLSGYFYRKKPSAIPGKADETVK